MLQDDEHSLTIVTEIFDPSTDDGDKASDTSSRERKPRRRKSGEQKGDPGGRAIATSAFMIGPGGKLRRIRLIHDDSDES